MTILYPTARQVKPATRRTFGRGLLASRPVVRDLSHTVADEAWYAASQTFDFDGMAADALAMSRVEAGLSY